MAKKSEYPENDEIRTCRARFAAILDCFCDGLDRMIGRGLSNELSVNIAMELTGASFHEAFKALQEVRNEIDGLTPNEEEDDPSEG